MITRILKVKIKPEHRKTFRAYIPEFICSARAFKNNHHADCFADLDEDNNFHVYTIWKTEGALNKFVKSELNIGFRSKIQEWQSHPFSAWTVETM